MSLHIPTPCHEDWNEMSPEGQGRFCGSCSKIVVDFTAMTDDEVRHYLLRHSGQSTCGRFYTRQLEQPAREQSISLPRHWFERLPHSRQLFYAVTLFFVVGVSSCNFSESSQAASPDPTYITQGAPVSQPDTSTKNLQDTTRKVSPKVVSLKEPVLTGEVAAIPDSVIEPSPVIMGGISAPPPPEAPAVPATPPSVPPAPQPEGRIDAPSAPAPESPRVIKGKVRLSEK